MTGAAGILLDLPSSAPFGSTRQLTFAIGTIATLHILISGLISAAGQLGPIVEVVGWVRRRADYDRLAHGISKWLALLFAIGSVLPFIFVTVLLTGMAGHFWTTIVRITWVPLVIELFSFLFEVLLVYLWYYSWNALQGRYKPLHLVIGLLLLLDDFLQVLMINVVASYMLTPQAPGDIFHVIVNPTFYELQVHRIVGNLAYLGYAIGAVAAWRFLRERDAAQRAHWDWMGSFGILTGTVLTFAQPMVGYSYAKQIQLSSYAAWYKMMLGSLSNVFLTQMLTLGLMFVVAGFYFALRLRRQEAPGYRVARVLALGLAVSTAFAALPYQLALTYDHVRGTGLDKPFWEGGLINPFGAMIPYKVGALIALTLLVILAVIWYLRGLRFVTWGLAGRAEQRLLLAGLVLVVCMITVMGVIRENGRSPDVIYGEIDVHQQPATTPSAPPAPPP
jgi:cytochrome bd-type quinol oxidase subunit 1